MKIVFAFDSYKGCMSAREACRVAAETIWEINPATQVVECPLSDGGEGLVECVEQLLPVKRITFQAHDPLMNPIEAFYALAADGKTAYMEMAATSGLPLVSIDKRNPMLTTTYGVGDMIAHAVQRGVEHIVMGIGGSATNDGGKGMIESLQDQGYLDAAGNIIQPALTNCRFTVACDVTNPLYGEKGASHIFGPQKGATREQVVLLDEQLKLFARETEKKGLATPDLAQYPGAGAAGGLGYGLLAYLKAELKSGIDIILDITHFDQLIEEADVVVTGEGKSDEQTLMGKLPEGVLKRCRSQQIPVWLLSGCIVDSTHQLADNFAVVKSINEGDPRSLDLLMQPAVAKENLKNMLSHVFVAEL